MKRESFNSRIGFLLVSAGCAIGIGNVWKFPYVTGQNGGGIFVILYLIFLVIMGAPILAMELAVGRKSRKSVVKAYKSLEKEGSKWHIHGWICLLGNLLLMMYYTTVSGWMMNYVVKFIGGSFEGEAGKNVETVFADMLASPVQMLSFMAITVVIGIVICSKGLQAGIEKITKVMMLGLLLLILLLAFRSFTLDGASEGIKFYLLPSWERAKEVGIRNVITAAMNQSFFTLSIGIGAMSVFGSYMSDEYSLGGEALRICILDTFVAIVSGLIIFPACFSYNVETTAGPSLIFITLPHVFVHMEGGRIWGSLFFLFMTFASLSTVIAVFENLIAAGIDNFGWDRKKSSIINFIILLLGGIPCALGYNIWSGIKLIGGRDILDSEDYLVSNLMLPIGSLVFLLFCVTKFGWGFDNFQEEANKGSGAKISGWLKYYFCTLLPLMIIIIIIQGI
ncbi:sodium-dependent transporter [Lachnospiraceae bacterium C1.1]|nr:sodium-dependent transporter [Lachnospiraceae bacterium C1.1]